MNKKSMEQYNISIDTMNVKRAFTSSICFIILVPVLEILAGVTQWNNQLKPFLMIMLAFMELVQIVFAVLIHMVVSKDRVEKYAAIYIPYYAVTILIMMISSGCDMETFGSQVFYVLSCMYFVFVPVLKERERLIFIAVQTFVMLVMLFVFKMGLRMMTDICLTQLCTVFMSRYEHELMFRRQRMTRRLKEKTSNSEHDALTGLINRRGLERRAEAVWPYCERKKIAVGMIEIDIDFFKKYNDTFGHPEGDKCLRMVADVLKESVRRSTDIITRTGGEEFLIFLQDVDEDELSTIALKIRKNLENKAIPHAYCIVSKNVTVSMGIASGIPGYNSTFKSLYEKADQALYKAKKNGRNCAVYEGKLYGRVRDGIAQLLTE